MDGPPDRGTPPRLPAGWSRPLAIVLAAAVSVGFLWPMLVATDGHFVPQISDLYLVCQYAKALAEGHPFRYNEGDPPSTGATSLLHTAVLGLAHAVGFRGEGLVAFAILSGAAAHLASVLAARRIALLLGPEPVAALAAALVALGGPVAWGFHYGSDIALFMLLALLLLEGLLEDAADGHGPGRRALAAATLLALARPEGLPLSVLLLAFWGWSGPRTPRRVARAAVPLAAALAVLVLYRVVTGTWLGTSVADKSLLVNYGAVETAALVSEYLVDLVRGLLLGFYPSQANVGFARGWAALYFPPLGLVFVAAAAALAPAAQRRALLAWCTLVAALFVLVAPNLFMGVHFNRYVLWAFPSLLVLVAVGAGALCRLLARGDPGAERALFRAVASVLGTLALLSTVRFATLYVGMASEMWRRDVAAAQWIRQHLPAGVGIANLATSVEYLTGHRSLNLHGVTSPAFFGNRTAERDAGVWEALNRLPEAERPPYLLTSVLVQEGSAVAQEIVDGPPVFQTNSFGDELLLFRTRYDLVGRGRDPRLPETLAAVRGLTLVDGLNVCDTRDERGHDYVFESSSGPLRLHGAFRVDVYPGTDERVADAGRAILGFESFRVRAARGRDLVVVMRTAAAVGTTVPRAGGSAPRTLAFPSAGIVVEVDGETSARLSFTPGPGWDEQVLRIPGRFLAEGATTRLRLSGRYASFRYWFYQAS